MNRKEILAEIQIQIDKAQENLDGCKLESEIPEFKRALKLQKDAYSNNVWLERFTVRGRL